MRLRSHLLRTQLGRSRLAPLGLGIGSRVNVYVGPRHGWYGYRPYYRSYAYHYGYLYGYYPYLRGRYWRGWY